MAAHYGVPVVLVTGDNCACAEAAVLISGIHTAVVTEHVGRLAAHSLHPVRACALIREAAQRLCAGVVRWPGLIQGRLVGERDGKLAEHSRVERGR